jgi:Bromodomain
VCSFCYRCTAAATSCTQQHICTCCSTHCLTLVSFIICYTTTATTTAITMCYQLDHGEYSSAAEFAADVRRTFSNALLFNPDPQTPVHLAAKEV